mmetsp:Transcript_62200/g.180370  ORF Transcript_62200/g.180370 Transcript_62200/m.180370 type:complete len:234 (+) Transcript_62200:171-872(+)
MPTNTKTRRQHAALPCSARPRDRISTSPTAVLRGAPVAAVAEIQRGPCRMRAMAARRRRRRDALQARAWPGLPMVGERAQGTASPRAVIALPRRWGWRKDWATSSSPTLPTPGRPCPRWPSGTIPRPRRPTPGRRPSSPSTRSRSWGPANAPQARSQASRRGRRRRRRQRRLRGRPRGRKNRCCPCRCPTSRRSPVRKIRNPRASVRLRAKAEASHHLVAATVACSRKGNCPA